MLPSDSSYVAVLVVEDEAIQRMVAVDLVQDLGFTAVEACDARTAIFQLELRHDIRIVFSDIQMPGSMDGLQLALLIRDRWPPIELILTSGGPRIEECDLPERGRFFGKPYNADQVKAAMRELAG